MPASEAECEVAIMPPAVGNSEDIVVHASLLYTMAQPAEGNATVYDNGLNHFKLGLIVAEAQREVDLRGKDMKNVKAMQETVGKYWGDMLCELYILIFVSTFLLIIKSLYLHRLQLNICVSTIFTTNTIVFIHKYKRA